MSKIKKSNQIKILPTFLGIMLLVAGLGTGIILVTEPQLLGSKAQVKTDYNKNCGGLGQVCCGDGVNWYSAYCNSGNICSNGTCVIDNVNCGHDGQRCCAGNKCTEKGDVCINGTCNIPKPKVRPNKVFNRN